MLEHIKIYTAWSNLEELQIKRQNIVYMQILP